MNLDMILSRVGIYDYAPDRKTAIKQILTTDKEEVWFIQDNLVRFLHKRKSVLNIDDSMLRFEHGFNKYNNKVEINCSALALTIHSLDRWNQRCNGMKLSIKELLDASNKFYLKLDKSMQKELYIPLEAGALLGECSFNDLEYHSMKDIKDKSNIMQYEYNKKSKKWFGAFITYESIFLVKTFIGMNELHNGKVLDKNYWKNEKENLQKLHHHFQSLILTSRRLKSIV